MTVASCSESIRSSSAWYPTTCGKPIKRDGMCGVHAAAADRRKNNDGERDRLRRERQAVAEALTAATGFTVRADTFTETYYLDTEQVRAWAASQQLQGNDAASH